MPPPLARPARRTTLYLFESDCQQLERRYGRGWTEQVRLMVADNCEAWQRERSPYGEWCRDPSACAGKGYCPKDPTCGD